MPIKNTIYIRYRFCLRRFRPWNWLQPRDSDSEGPASFLVMPCLWPRDYTQSSCAFFTVTVECVIYSLKAPWLISDEGGSTEAPVMVKIHLLTWQPQLEMWPMPRRTWLIFIDLFVFLRFLKMFLIKFPLTVSHMYILCSDCLPPTFSYLPSTPAITLSPCRSLSHIHVI